MLSAAEVRARERMRDAAILDAHYRGARVPLLPLVRALAVEVKELRARLAEVESKTEHHG